MSSCPPFLPIFLSTALVAGVLAVRELAAADCNQNDVEDAQDIAAGASADCNQDGVPDECESEPPPGGDDPKPVVSVTFLQERLPLQGRFEPHATALDDLDDDGWLDLVTMDGENRVLVLRNDGSGALEIGATYTLTGMEETIWIAVADLDGDGLGDVAAVDESTDNLAVLANEGDGTFRQTSDVVRAGSRPVFVAAADFDEDGAQDLAVADEGTGRVRVFINRGDASFFAPVDYAAASSPVGLALGDFDGARGADIAAVGLFRLSVFLNAGDGTFGERRDFEVPPARFIAAADFDDDGDLDLVVAHGERLGLYENDGVGAFSSRVSIELDTVPRSVVAADLDADGLPDLITGNEQANSTSFVRNRGGWEFSAPHVERVGDDPRFVVAGDLDRDGDADVVAANHSSYDLSLLYTRTVSLFEPPFLEEICTYLDFHEVSVPGAGGGAVVRWTRFLVPVDPQRPGLVPALFANARFESMRSFLDAVFPQRFAGISAEEFDGLVGRRGTREFYTGTLARLEIGDEALYGFNVLAEEETDAAELLVLEELALVHRELAARFSLDALVYLPATPAERAVAAGWPDPGFPIWVPGDRFRRGDAAGDGTIDLGDAFVVLFALFQGGRPPSCAAAADANGDGWLDVSDPVAILLYLFAGVGPFPGPFEACGLDPLPGSLGCERYAICDGAAES